MRIVFVCTTNVWGSAMAELMARSLLSEWDPDRRLVQVTSAGVRAQVGAPMPGSGQQVLAERGIDGSTHQARWMSPEVLHAADLTVTIGEPQRDAALALNPRGLRNTFTLLEAVELLARAADEAQLGPRSDANAGTMVENMAGARRYRAVSGGRDDLPDILPDHVPSIRDVADHVQAGVRTLLFAAAFPPFADNPTFHRHLPLARVGVA